MASLKNVCYPVFRVIRKAIRHDYDFIFTGGRLVQETTNPGLSSLMGLNDSVLYALREPIKIIIVTQQWHSCHTMQALYISIYNLHVKSQVIFRLLCKTLNPAQKDCAKPIWVLPTELLIFLPKGSPSINSSGNLTKQRRADCIWMLKT